MLVDFTVENYRSIKEEALFSMLSTKDRTLDNNLISMDGMREDDRLLKSAAIYGANASGKSNVILAMFFLKSLVTNSHLYQKGQRIRFEPFKLDEKSLKKPTRFQIVFIKNRLRYLYLVSFNGERIIEESLHCYPKNRKAMIFERKKTTNFKFTKNVKKQTFISERTLGNALYLSKSAQENFGPTLPAFEWFDKDLMMIGPMVNEDITVGMLQSDKKMKELVLKALSAADLGIEDFSTDVKDMKDFAKGMTPELQSYFKRMGVSMGSLEIRTFRKGIPFYFNSEESEGTKRMFYLIGYWIHALKNAKVLIIDEIETKLHPLLSKFLVDLFHGSKQNRNNAQLVFTTHNTYLLDQDIFRRDQIWFTEKNAENGKTDLYSLVEYKPRKDKDIRKGYFAGRYGALPFVKDNGIF